MSGIRTLGNLYGESSVVYTVGNITKMLLLTCCADHWSWLLGARNGRYQTGTSKFISYIWGQKEVTRRQGKLYNGYGSAAIFFLSKILSPPQCGVIRQFIIVENPAADLHSD